MRRIGVATLVVVHVVVFLSSSFTWYQVSFRTGVAWVKSVALTIALAGVCVWVRDVTQPSGTGKVCRFKDEWKCEAKEM